MNKFILRFLIVALSSTILLTFATSSFAASKSQKKACKKAVLEKKKFRDIPKSSVSVSSGEKKNRVDFSVKRDGLKASGYCKLNGDKHVKKVKIKHYQDNRLSKHKKREKEINTYDSNNYKQTNALQESF